MKNCQVDNEVTSQIPQQQNQPAIKERVLLDYVGLSLLHEF